MPCCPHEALCDVSLNLASCCYMSCNQSLHIVHMLWKKTMGCMCIATQQKCVPAIDVDPTHADAGSGWHSFVPPEAGAACQFRQLRPGLLQLRNSLPAQASCMQRAPRCCCTHESPDEDAGVALHLVGQQQSAARYASILGWRIQASVIVSVP